MSLAELAAVLSYNPETGVLTWKERPSSDFSDTKKSAPRKANIWQGCYAGKPAGALDTKSGYIKINFKGRAYKAHRVAWLLHYGKQPPPEVDHEDHNRSNNRIVNLRGSNALDNSKNQKLRKTNTTGHVGVSKGRSGKYAGKYMSYICSNGKQVTLGRFDTLDEAVEARKKAAPLHGFHANHGS